MLTTNLAGDMADILTKRVIIPVADAEADVTYYMVCQKQKKAVRKSREGNWKNGL